MSRWQRPTEPARVFSLAFMHLIMMQEEADNLILKDYIKTQGFEFIVTTELSSWPPSDTNIWSSCEKWRAWTLTYAAFFSFTLNVNMLHSTLEILSNGHPSLMQTSLFNSLNQWNKIVAASGSSSVQRTCIVVSPQLPCEASFGAGAAFCQGPRLWRQLWSPCMSPGL